MKNFTAKQKEIIARKLGYDGPMQGFDEFVQSSPALAMKYEMINDKYTERMNKGGAVMRYQAGGDVMSPEDFKSFLYAGGANDQEATERILKYGAEKGLNSQQLVGLTNSALGTKFTEADLARAVDTSTVYGSGSAAKAAATGNVTTTFDASGTRIETAAPPPPPPAVEDTIQEQTPVEKLRASFDQTVLNKTPQEKAAYYNSLLDAGYDDATIRAAINAPEDQNWSQLRDMAQNLRSGAGGDNTGGGGGVTTQSAVDKLRASFDQSIFTKTPTEKAAYYNSLLAAGYDDATIRAAINAPEDANWSELKRIATGLRSTGGGGADTGGDTGGGGVGTGGDTGTTKNPATQYGEGGKPTLGDTTKVTAAQTAITDEMRLKGKEYEIGASPQAVVKTAGTAQQAVAGTTGAAQTVTSATATPGVQSAVGTLTPAKGTVSAPMQAAQGTLSPGALATAVTPAQAAQVQAPAPLQATPDMLARAATVADVGGVTRAQAEQSQYASGITAQQRQVTEQELVDVQRQNLQMETVQAVAATMDKLNSDAIASAAQGNLFVGQAEAQQGRVQAEMTLRGQLEKYMSDFNDGTPAWAAGAMRAANAAMAARGLAGSSMAGAAIVQAAMESATPLAAADAQVFTQMQLTNLNNRQQVALANAAAAQQMEIANMSARQQTSLQNSANAFALQSQNLSNTQATILANAQLRAAAAEKNLDVRTQSAIVNAARVADVNNLNLNLSQQAMLARSAENLQVEMTNLSARQQTAVANAQIEAALKGQELSNRQQTGIVNASRVAEIAQMNFTAAQQKALADAQFIQQINVQDMSNRQATTLANAAAIASMDMANLNARQQAAVQNAQAFLQMDMANLSNTQQTALFKAQALSQAALSDAASENAARQFNASSKQQSDQFSASLSTQVSQFNAAQSNAIKQFNVSQENAMSQFNTQMTSQRQEFNARNRIIIDQANAQLIAQISTANTAATNAANFQNAQAMNNMTLAQYNNEVQLYRDQVKMVFDAYERQEDRSASMATAVLQAEISREKISAETSAAYGKLVGAVIGTKVGEKVLDGALDFIKKLNPFGP